MSGPFAADSPRLGDHHKYAAYLSTAGELTYGQIHPYSTLSDAQSTSKATELLQNPLSHALDGRPRQRNRQEVSIVLIILTIHELLYCHVCMGQSKRASAIAPNSCNQHQMCLIWPYYCQSPLAPLDPIQTAALHVLSLLDFLGSRRPRRHSAQF